jgi:hypothetical protein
MHYRREKSSRRPSKNSGDHASQLATYAALMGDYASGETRIDALVSPRDSQMLQMDHVPGESDSRSTGLRFH